MSAPDWSGLREKLAALAVARPDVFGAIGHEFRLGNPLEEREVAAFERTHGISLPGDYRAFLTSAGNGGAGPFWGVFPLGQMDDIGETLQSWREGDGFVGRLREPFALSVAWNDVSDMPAADLFERDEAEYELRMSAFDELYWESSRVNGAIPICHVGCALRIWLVVTGAQKGYLWRDDRADYKGLKPLALHNGERATFGEWYGEWLDEAVAKAQGAVLRVGIGGMRLL